MQRAPHSWWLALGLTASVTAALPAAASGDGEVAFHRGVVAFDAGGLDQARREFEAVLARDPGDREALRYLAQIVEAQGDPASALRLLDRLVALDPGDRELRLDRTVVLLVLGRTTEVRDALAALLEEDPGDAKAQLYAGIAAYRAGDLAAAPAHLRRAADLDPSLAPRSRYTSGLVAAAQGDLVAAESAFASVARRSPVSWLGRFAAGLAGALHRREPARAWSVALATDGEWDDPWRLQSEEDDLDLQTEGRWISPARALGPLGVARRAYAPLGVSEPFGPLHGGALAIPQGDWGPAQPGTPLPVARFERPGLPPGGFEPDGARPLFWLSRLFSLPRPFRSLTVGAVGDGRDPLGTGSRYTGFETAFGAGYDLPHALSFSWLWRFAHRDYREANAFEPFAGRVDDTHWLTAEVARPILEHWTARLAGSFAFQDSNLPLYDQERKAVGASLTYEW